MAIVRLRINQMIISECHGNERVSIGELGEKPYLWT